MSFSKFSSAFGALGVAAAGALAPVIAFAQEAAPAAAETEEMGGF